MFEYYNANIYDRHVADCSVRAISLATGRTWDETYRILSEAARKSGRMMDSVDFIEDYLDKRYDRICRYSKTVGEFIDEYPYGTYVISMPSHLTCVINGINYDTFDTTNRKMWCAWRIN